jgi:hypothetical protein
VEKEEGSSVLLAVPVVVGPLLGRWAVVQQVVVVVEVVFMAVIAAVT